MFRNPLIKAAAMILLRRDGFSWRFSAMSDAPA